MSNRIKICFFNGFFPVRSGGSEYQTYLLAKSLNPENFDIFFISLEGDRNGEYHINGFKIYGLKTRKILSKFGPPTICYYRGINTILAKMKPDIVYQRIGSAATGILSYLSTKYGFRFIWACPGQTDLEKLILTPPPGILANVDNLLRIYGIKRAKTILVQSSEQQKALHHRFQREAIILPNSHPIPRENIHKKPKPMKVIWIANFTTVKQPEMFVDLSSEFSGYPDVEFIMVGRSGKGRWQSRLQKRISNLNNLVATGEQPQEQVNRILSGGHVLVNTSTHEGFPNTFIQAWMRRVPVVSLDVDPDDLLTEKQIGFRSVSFESCCKHVKRLVHDKSLHESMGARARDYALKNHSLKIVSKEFNDLITALAAK